MGLLDDITGFINSTITTVQAAVQNDHKQISDNLDKAGATVAQAINKGVAQVQGLINTAYAAVGATPPKNIGQVSSQLEDTYGKIADTLAVDNQKLHDIFTNVGDAPAGGINTKVDDARQKILDIINKVTDPVAQAVNDLGDQLAPYVAPTPQGPLSPDQFQSTYDKVQSEKQALIDAFNQQWDESRQESQPQQYLAALAKLKSDLAALDAELSAAAAPPATPPATPDAGALGGAASAAAGLLGAAANPFKAVQDWLYNSISARLFGESRTTMNYYASALPTVFSKEADGSYTFSIRRGYEHMNAQGVPHTDYDEFAVDQASFNRPTGLPTPIGPVATTQADSFRLFGLITSIGLPFAAAGALNTPLASDIQRRAWAAYPSQLPGPSDLTTFQLREVFEPAMRAEQLANYPGPQYFEAMQEQGYNTYWSESYWAAHWKLPSTGDGYEMLHRLRPGRVDKSLEFTYDDLVRLMRRNDILPAYIDRLAKVAYQPLTRIDVRRMRQLNVLSDAEVKEAYLDLGYDDQRAQFLADFVKADIDNDDATFIRSTVISAYKAGLVPREDLDLIVRPTFRDARMYNYYISLLDAQAAKDAKLAIRPPGADGGRGGAGTPAPPATQTPP